jgi:competence protein ComEC
MGFSFAFLLGVIGALLFPAVPPAWVLASIGAATIALVACTAARGKVFPRRRGSAGRGYEAPQPTAAGDNAAYGSVSDVSTPGNCAAGDWLPNQCVSGRRALLNRSSLRWVVCGLAVGFLYAAIQANLYLTHRWSAARSDERVIASAIIDTIPTRWGDSYAFDVIATVEKPTQGETPLRVRVVSRAPEVIPHVGDRWRLLLALRPPRARVNPGTSDQERVLFRDRVHALGTVVSSSVNHRLDAGHRPLDAIRERVAARINERVVDRDAAALISALAVGVTGNMSREQWRVFNATGTTHLVAISGLHVTLFAVVAFAASRAVWSALFYRLVRRPRENFAAVVGFVAAAVYATLAGLSVPTQRTLIMLGVWLYVRCLARATPPFHTFALALIAVLALDPFAPLAPGFWLSFGAMAAIILITSSRFSHRSMLLEAFAVQGAVTLALIPFTLAAFGSMSVVGPLVNLLAIPAMSWIFVPTILLSLVLVPVAPVASDGMLKLAAWLHDAGWPWLAAAADVPWALIHASPPLWWYGLAAIALCILFMPLPRALRVATLIWVFPLAASISASPRQGAAEVMILDAGEGTAIVVLTEHHVLVFGSGDAYGTEGRIAESVLIPFLRSRGVKRIDRLVLSRFKAAAADGVTALLAEFPVDETLVGGESPPTLDGAHECSAEHQWNADGIGFRILRARASLARDGACAVAIEARDVRVLIAGDVDAGSERDLVEAADVSAQVVVVPRHGSDTASSPELIRAVGARWAVVQGRRDREGRQKAALGRWRESGSEVLATADLGAIRFRIDPTSGLEGPMAARLAYRTLWRGSP